MRFIYVEMRIQKLDALFGGAPVRQWKTKERSREIGATSSALRMLAIPG